MFVSDKGLILQDDTEYLWLSIATLGTEAPHPVTGLDLFYCILLFLTVSKTGISFQIYQSKYCFLQRSQIIFRWSEFNRNDTTDHAVLGIIVSK